MTFLIVEDNARIQRVLRRILADTASAIWKCADGAESAGSFMKNIDRTSF
jgi:hypothetical protein